MYDGIKLLPKSQFQQLLKLLPTPRKKHLGRKHCNKKGLVTGILQVLVNGVAWKKIADCGCSYASCFRYLHELQRRGTLKLVLQRLVHEKVDITVGSIDTTLVLSFAFRDMTAWNGQHKQIGTKVSLFVGKDGLSADVQFGKGNKNDKDFLLDPQKRSWKVEKDSQFRYELYESCSQASNEAKRNTCKYESQETGLQEKKGSKVQV